MKGNFDQCDKVTLAEEGGYSNHPKDPGGRTLQGITQKTYNAYRDRKKLPRVRLDRKMLGQPDWNAERDEIYRTGYWDTIRGDELPAGVDLITYDISVNSGPGRAAKILQAALIAVGQSIGSSPTPDGVIGLRTIAACRNVNDTAALVADMARRRQAFYKAQEGWKTFGDGWTKRNVRVRDAALTLLNVGIARHTAPTAAETDMAAKAPDAAVPTTSVTVEQTGMATGAALGGATVLTGLKDLLDQCTGYLLPLKDFGGPVAEVVGYALVAIGVISALYGIYTAYVSFRRRDVLQAKTTAAILPGEAGAPPPADEDDGLQAYVPPPVPT